MAEMTILQRAGIFLQRRPKLKQGVDFLLRPIEIVTKKPVFGCQMCGQCVLHSTGMTCPMNCPKSLRNGPCGGVHLDGSCEVKPEMVCVWVRAYQRSQKLPWPTEIHDLHPPVDWSLAGSSSWVNHLTGDDLITSGCINEPKTALAVVINHDG